MLFIKPAISHNVVKFQIGLNLTDWKEKVQITHTSSELFVYFQTLVSLFSQHCVCHSHLF